jgi:hypothetical protein
MAKPCRSTDISLSLSFYFLKTKDNKQQPYSASNIIFLSQQPTSLSLETCPFRPVVETIC